MSPFPYQSHSRNFELREPRLWDVLSTLKQDKNVVCAKCVCIQRWEQRPWRIEKTSGPIPFRDTNGISPFCPRCLYAKDLVNMSLRSHVSCISPSPQLLEETLAQIALEKSNGELGELDWLPCSCSQEKQGGKLLTWRLAGDAGSFKARRHTKPLFIALSVNSFHSP